MPGPRRRNTVTHAAAVVAALQGIQSGEAANKSEAAELAGISPGALSPANLANTAKNPILRHLIRTDPLDITADVDGRRVSMREALSKGAENTVATLAKLSAKAGALDKAESEQLRQCRAWLDLCKQMGMFREMDAPALPGELMAGMRAQEDDGPAEGSVEWYMLHGNTHAQPAGLLRVLPAVAISSQDEGTVKTGKECPQPFQPSERATA